MSEETLAALRALSEASGEPVSAVIRRSIAGYLAGQTDVDDAFSREIAGRGIQTSREYLELFRDGTMSIGDGVGSITEVQLSSSAGRGVMEEAKTVELGLLEKAPDGETKGKDSPTRLVTEVHWVSAEAKRLLAKNPAELHSLDWRRFEEVVAELLADHGYDVTLVPQGRDTGVDIFAARKVELGSFLYLVQCKKYDPGHRVGLQVVDRLYGRVAADQATAGVVATTSHFTKYAKDFAETVAFQMSLKDFDSLCDWLQIWRPGG